MHLFSHRRLTAWLGLFAMWLVLSAPIVSQVLAHQQRHAHAHALSHHMQDRSTEQACAELQLGAQSGDLTDRGDHLEKTPATSACGYCDLLATHAALPALAPAAPAAVVLVAFAAFLAPTERAIPLGAFPSGRAREPPVFS
ncbi:DUF2946 domain-containing protein [Trinickia sp. Y13]|uniref:DUF2946 domain-containing protein n=1 Tax=Trinickia sp. Y13 TaxID=2917807 RepID=UPI0024055382|nr:DUF2946 domain-containing protein [Trinickia sp. Y13]